MVKTSAEALVLERARVLALRRMALPQLGPRDGLLRVEACGLCGTDHELYTGHLRHPFSFVPGHEVVGIVEEAGDEALERWGVARGDRVAVEPFYSCRECDRCVAGNYRFCRLNGARRMVGAVDVAEEPSLWGGYATHLYLPPDSLLLRVPEGLDPIIATLFNPLGAGVRWGVTLPQTVPGDVVAVMGCGLRGLFSALAAKAAGASFVMVTGWGERDRSRLDLAEKFGADLTVDASFEDPARRLREAQGRLADVVVHVAAKAPASLAQAVTLASGGGTIALAGLSGQVEAAGFIPDHVVHKELTIVGALGVDIAAYEQALELLAAGPADFAAIPRSIADLKGLPALLATMAGEGDEEPPLHGVLVP
jgi:alcohol dehydrogenase